MHALENFLYETENWREILTEPPYCLSIKEKDNLVLFSYSQIESDFSKTIVQEAKGIILEKDTWNVVCRPFQKFFNYGEPNAAEIRWWDKILVNKKIDGSLMKVYYYNGEWRVATNNNIDANDAKLYIYEDGVPYKSFYDLFIAGVLNEYSSFDEFTNELSKDYTYLFELVSPYTRVVIPYENIELYKLGSIHNLTGYFTKPADIYLNFRRPNEVKFNNIEDIINRVASYDWTFEGFVVFDGTNRIKIKSPAYVKAHYARNNGNVGLGTLIDVVLQNEQDEFLTYAEEYTDIINNITDLINDVKNNILEKVNALAVINLNVNPIEILSKESESLEDGFFKKLHNGAFVREYINSLPERTLVKYIKEKLDLD